MCTRKTQAPPAATCLSHSRRGYTECVLVSLNTYKHLWRYRQHTLIIRTPLDPPGSTCQTAMLDASYTQTRKLMGPLLNSIRDLLLLPSHAAAQVLHAIPLHMNGVTSKPFLYDRVGSGCWRKRSCGSCCKPAQLQQRQWKQHQQQ